RGEGPNEIAAWLARATRAEAASVQAFVALREELIALNAPAPIVKRAARAAADEVRHARLLGALAEAGGASSSLAARRRDLPARSLLELALENAVEGCVHETFAALMAMHQARHASDPALREAMAAIAG